jgi:hypothetical protein
MIDLKNPFPGIRPFRQADAECFFGRTHLILELLDKLEQKRFVSIVGTSGCGKSSLINAGLLPLLAQKNWEVIVSRPQDNPINNLAQELRKLRFAERVDSSGDPSSEELHRIWESMIPITLNLTSQGLVDTYRQSSSKNKLLIIIDQFEELFQYKSKGNSERENAIKFVNLLLEATNQKEYPIHVIIVMRADFLGHCAQFKGFPEMINDGQFLIPRLTRDQYRDAITGPLEKQNVRIASNVVSQLLNEIEDDPDQLPILQHALMLTFEEWRKAGNFEAVIDIKHYNDSGGMTQGIDAHCNLIMQELANDGLTSMVRILFRRLTEINLEGIEIRAPAKVKELMILTDLKLLTITRILDAFRKDGRNFLYPSIDRPILEEQVIDLSHECIMRKWSRLQGWIKEEENDKRDLLKLVEHYKNFSAGERQHLKGLTLTNYLNWAPYKNRAHPATSQWASRYTTEFSNGIDFVTTSKKVLENAQRRKRAIRRGFVVGIPLIIIILISLYYWRSIKSQHKIIFDNKVRIDSVQNALIDKTIELDNLKDLVNLSKDIQMTNNVYRENNLLKKTNSLVSDSLFLAFKQIASLRERNDTLLSLLKARNSEVNQLRSNFSSGHNQLLQSLDSAIRSSTEKQMLNERYKIEFERLRVQLQDTIQTYRNLARTEKGLKTYFASQFAEALKTNHLLLDQLEKRLNSDSKDQAIDPELTSFIRKYLKDNRDKLGSVLGDISILHKVILYSIHEDATKRQDEFASLLRRNGFDGKLERATVHKSFFPDVGITILAFDQKTFELFKTAVISSKSSSVRIFDKIPGAVSLRKPEENVTIMVLH